MKIFGLDRLTGIGPRTLEKLRSAGIETLEDLVKSNPRELSSATGIPAIRIVRWIEEARELLKKEKLL